MHTANVRTESELLFELFCRCHDLHATPIPTSSRPTPDYELSFREFTVLVEIKQIESDEGLDPTGVSSLVDVNYPDRSATTILAGGSGE